MVNSSNEKRLVMIGATRLHVPLTYAQAQRYGDQHMPPQMRRAGFNTLVFVSDAEINGGTFYRINYGKKC